jgi:hypothetical protein
MLSRNYRFIGELALEFVRKTIGVRRVDPRVY